MKYETADAGMDPGVYVEKDDTWFDDGWTAVPNAVIRHPRLTADAKWAYAWLASHTATFQITAELLAEAGPKGRNHARQCIRQLEEHGWLTRSKLRNPRTGRYDVTKYRLHPTPVPESRRTFVPSVAKPRAFPKNPSSSPGADSSVVGADLREGAGPDDAENALFDPAEV